MLWNYLTLLEEIRWGDLLDIGLAAGFVWFGIHALRTMRIRKVGVGLMLYGVVILAAGQLGLKLTTWILQALSAVIILVVVVVYQSEIRRILERFPASLLSRSQTDHAEAFGLADLLVHSLLTLAEKSRGALVVLAGTDTLTGIITAGIPLGGRISKALLLSIFDPNSPGHDGAVVIQGDRVERFGSRLPLSERDEQLKERGTRHAAALGLSERTDALVLIVSEESGAVSVAHEGRLRQLADPEAFRTEIAAFLEKHFQSEESAGRFKKIDLWGALEGFAGLLVATILWLILVPGSVIQNVTYEIPIEVQNIPAGYSLASVTPETVAVTLSGEKHSFFQVEPKDLLIRLDGTLTSFGRQTYPITSAHLLLPPDLEIADLAPEQVRVMVRKLD